MNDNQKKERSGIFGITIATLVIIGVGVGFYLNKNVESASTSELGSYSDPEIALKETQKALSLLSKHVNTGYKSVEYIDEYENTKNIIFNID